MSPSYKEIPTTSTKNKEIIPFEPSELTEQQVEQLESNEGVTVMHPFEISNHESPIFQKEAEGALVEDHVKKFLKYGTPIVLTEAYKLKENDPPLIAFPLLNPGSMKKLSTEELDTHFEDVRDTGETEDFLQVGPTLILSDDHKEVAAYDGSVERTVNSVRGEISDETWAAVGKPDDEIIKRKIEGNESPALLFNVAEYPLTQEINSNNIVLSIEGTSIKPTDIADIVRNADIEGAFGVNIVVDGKITCLVPHTMPQKPIQMSDLTDYANIANMTGTFIGNGTCSSLKGHENNLHIHMGTGHMAEASGTILVVISPAKAEVLAEYAEF